MKAEPLALRAGEQALWDGRFRVSLPKAPRGQRLAVRALGQAGLAQLVAHDIVIPKAPKPALLALPGLWREGALVAAPHLGTLDPRIACHAALRRPAAFPSQALAGKA
jgi:tRNA(Ile)-lysidine synthase